MSLIHALPVHSSHFIARNSIGTEAANECEEHSFISQKEISIPSTKGSRLSLSKCTSDSDDELACDEGEEGLPCSHFKEKGNCMNGQSCSFNHQQKRFREDTMEDKSKITKAILLNFPELILCGAVGRSKSFLK